jgi:hypothetical protein
MNEALVNGVMDALDKYEAKIEAEGRQDLARDIIDNGLYEAAVALMDDEIREDLNREMAPCTEEAFLVAYMGKHYKKYGFEFFV